jgi:hypothetical protein
MMTGRSLTLGAIDPGTEDSDCRSDKRLERTELRRPAAALNANNSLKSTGREPRRGSGPCSFLRGVMACSFLRGMMPVDDSAGERPIK